MTPAQVRAMTVACELDRLNTVRGRRAAAMRAPDFRYSSPAGMAGYLMGTAHLDQRRRQLRALLADQLNAAAAEMSGSHA